MNTHVSTAVFLAGLLLFPGCDRHEDGAEHGHDTSDVHASHGEHDHDEDGAGHGHEAAESLVKFNAQEGLKLPAEVIQALRIETAPLGRGDIREERKLVGQVLSHSGRTLALTRQRPEVANELRTADFPDAALVEIDESSLGATGMADVLLEVPRRDLKAGDFISVTAVLKRNDTLLAPASCLLEGPSGQHVYLKSNDTYRRVPVVVGLRNLEVIEITRGLSEGDEMVSNGADQLWLAELRLTKGGGHSH